MKANSLLRYTKVFVTFLMVYLWTTFSVSAQCPTLNSSPPPTPIPDAAGYTFADLSTDYAIDNGGGIVWYDAATLGNPFNNTQLVQDGTTYYADDNMGTCTRVSVTVDFQVDPTGEIFNGIYCSNDSATIQTFIDDELQPFIPSGGDVEIYYDFGLTNLSNLTDMLPIGFTNYYIIFTDSSGGRSQIEIGQTAIDNSPAEPTPNNPQAFCSDPTPTIGDLDPGTTDSFNWYASKDANDNGVPPALNLTDPLIDGATYYVQAIGFFCTSTAVAVTVEVDDPVDAGTPTPAEFCEDNLIGSPPLDLFGQLVGQDSGGIWTDDNGTGALAGSDIDLTLLPIGTSVFTYTVLSGNACPDAMSSVNITVFETLSSGTAVTPSLEFCESTAPASFDLFDLLTGEDAGGTWSDDDATGRLTGSILDLSGLASNTYDFTYTQNALPNPCLEESTLVQVTILPDPNAGTEVTPAVEFCENDLATNSPFNLFDALTPASYDSGGTWTDATNTIIPDPTNLVITGFSVASSPYSFTYTVDNGTCTDDETITITIEPAPESGNALAPFEVCEENVGANSPFDLFSILDGTQDTNGTWYIGTDTSGTVVTNPIDISALTDGTFNYTYSVPDIGTCSDVDVTVQIIVFPTPETGTPTAAIFCENDLVANSPLDLFGQLVGEDSGGTWADDDATGALTISDVDLTALTIGSYSFTYSITDTNGCTNSSTVIVTVEDAPESGIANTPVQFCIADVTVGQTYNLFDLLIGEDQTGTWNDDDTSGALSGNTVTLDGLAQGTYNFTFDVDAIGSCDDVNVTVSITINDTPAPVVTSPQEFCDTATVSDLIATGNSIQWYDNATGGTPLAGTTALVDSEDYYASQIDTITGCESSLRTEVIATIYQTPNAGNPNATTILACNDNSSIDLDIGLDGTQDAGGVWQDTDGTGALTGNVFDATGLAAGTYQFTYYVTASAPCVDDSTTITVTIDEPLNAGTDNTLDVCSNNGTTDLFILLGGADTGGTWSPVLDSGTGVFNPLIDAQGTYTYSLTNACGTASSEIVVSVTQAPNAGADNSVSICVIDGITDLFPLLGNSAQSGGTWFPALPSGTGEFNPSADAAGVYTYTVTAVSPCTTDASASITVTVDDSTAPVVNNPNPEFCLVNNPTVSDLDDALTITGTVNWYEDAALTIVANSSDNLIDGEDYYATQTNSSACESSTNVSVTVTINETPTPTLITSNQELCINDNPIISELTSNIDYDSSIYNVVWYDADSGGSVVSESSLLSNGATYYAVLVDLVTGCESSVRLDVTPDLTSCGELIIPDGFSPNGDGVNDTFNVDNLAILHPNFEMEIYNRNGNMVYKGNANTPRFDGKSNQSGTIGSGDLPVGVYFYIFNYKDGTNKTKQGRLYLSR